jgi:hypothetical protein
VAAPVRERERGARGRATQGSGGGNGSVPLLAGPEADKRDVRENARAVWTDAFRAWVIPMGRVFYPRGYVQTCGGRSERPAGDALKECRRHYVMDRLLGH